jgi:uncharacterized protein (TIGR02171 family)
MFGRNTTLIGFFLAVIISCSSHMTAIIPHADLPHPGMNEISSAGKSFQQGWDDTLASLDEKPGMQSAFTYNYWIDTVEVTQKQFYDYTGRRPVSDTSSFGTGDNFPVYYVTWFDASLYCNARSKAEGLDTVYAYSDKKILPTGSVYELTGLRADLSKDGYRLPTEAEWEFAARGGTSNLPFSKQGDSVAAQTFAWFSTNSGGKTHPMATKAPNSLGLYDMAGNVFEWTNDWKALYDGKSIINSLGALLPGSQYEKVIKGGAYNYGLAYLRPSRRSATYATILSSANEYVGFRCARGSISNGQFLGIGQQVFTPNPVSIVTGSDALRVFIGTSEAKIVFVNTSGQYRTLGVVDFSRTFPFVQEYVDDICVYMPTISPDGRFVAYCSSDEGLSTPSKISIRSLDSLGSPLVKLNPDTAYIPRWWVNQLTGDTCIVYTNSAVTNSSPLWKSTKTFLQKMSAGKPVGSPEELISDGGYHDGLSGDKKYTATGYDRLMVRNLQTREERQLFLPPDNGKNASGSTQVCNASISPDTGENMRCLFLDFGCPGTSTVTGCSYQLHQYLFISSISGKIAKCIRCPGSEQSWDNPEWTNQVQFAVSCGRNSADEAHSIYIVDLQNGIYQPIVTGIELQQPYCWIGFLAPNPHNYSLDSIGRYNEPPSGQHQDYLSSKFLAFWKHFDTLEVIALGSSQALCGFDPQRITGLKAFNMAAPGGGLLGQESIISNYVFKHCQKIRVICSSLDPGWLGNPDGDFSWNAGVPQSKGYNYDRNNNFWQDSVTSDFRQIINLIPLAIPACDSNMGLMTLSSPGWWGPNPPPCGGSISWDTTDINYQRNLSSIIIMSDTFRVHGVHWIMIDYPMSPYYKNTEYYGPFGPSRTTAHEITQNLRALEASNRFFHLDDANMDGNHDYTSAEAGNENHLVYAGAEKLSTRVDSLIHAILQQ